MQTLRARCSCLAILLLTTVPAGAAQREAVRTLPKLDLTPFAGKDVGRAELVPVLAGEHVLVTSTLRLFAFDARTAELRWSAGPPHGWDALEPAVREQLFDGLDLRLLWVAPAASERVVVAALQLPLSRNPTEDWHGIQIATAVPERRLFAFELDSGRPLWNHAPAGSGQLAEPSFAQEMTLTSSPTVTGSRVLVPCTSDESSVDYHVACYELTTGALLWNTFVLRGQLERNSFGKAMREFAGPPLVAVAERGCVLAQTGLGAIAALDLATGTLLWRTDYYPIPVPKARTYTAPKREVVWRTTPPIVVGDVVLATPPDSFDLMALDLAYGHVLWINPARSLASLHSETAKLGFDHLIGASADVIYVGGSKLSAFAKRGGFRSPRRFENLWTVPLEQSWTLGRAQLAGEGIFQPGPGECLVLDRKTGTKGNDHALTSRPRGFLVTDGALYALGDDGLKRIER